jgi:WD40 repeat protein
MATDDTNYAYDVFISYTFNDRMWVNRELLKPLDDAGAKVCIDYRDFAAGAPILDEIERAISESRKTVFVFSPAYLKSEWTRLEQLVPQTIDPANRERRFLALLRETCDIPLRFQSFIPIDFRDPTQRAHEYKRLAQFLGKDIPPHVHPPSGTRQIEYYTRKVYWHIARGVKTLADMAEDAAKSSGSQQVDEVDESDTQQSKVPETPIKDFFAYAGGLAILFVIIFIFSLMPMNALDEHSSAVQSIDFAPDGRTLASGSRDGTAKVWHLHDNPFQRGTVQHTLYEHQHWVESIAFSPDGEMLASGSRDSEVRIWNAIDGSLLSTLPDHTASIKGVAFSPDGEMLASASADDTIILWDVAEAVSLKTLDGHTEDVESVAFSPTGKTLASGSADDTIILWSVTEDITLCTLSEHTDDVKHVAFSPDGDMLASASADNTIILWQVRGCEIERILSGHTGDVESVAFSPDGEILASGSRDTEVRLWRVSDGELLDSIDDHHAGVHSVAFRPDGRMLASGSSDRRILLHETENYSIQAQSTPETSHQMVTPIVIPDQRKQP